MRRGVGSSLIVLSALGAVASAYVVLHTAWLSATPAWATHTHELTLRFALGGVGLLFSVAGVACTSWLCRRARSDRTPIPRR